MSSVSEEEWMASGMADTEPPPVPKNVVALRFWWSAKATNQRTKADRW